MIITFTMKKFWAADEFVRKERSRKGRNIPEEFKRRPNHKNRTTLYRSGFGGRGNREGEERRGKKFPFPSLAIGGVVKLFCPNGGRGHNHFSFGTLQV